MMKTIQVNSKLSLEERETHLNYDAVAKQWIADSMIPKHFRKLLKQGWTPITQYLYEDGTVCGMILTGPERAITFRNVEPKKMSEKQLGNLFSDDDDEL